MRPASTSPDRAILQIALPAMLTNVATALFGLADMWVIGRLGDPAAQGAVELGTKFLITLLTVFNFLKTATVALTAQATGRGDDADQAATLTRGVVIALGIGLILLALKGLLIPSGLTLLAASGQIGEAARTYIDIRYWGGTAWLINCVLVGWLIGRKQMRAVLAVEIGANLFHVALDILLVLGLSLGVAGVAFATLCSELAKLAALMVIVARQPPFRQALGLVALPATWSPSQLSALFRMNRDLFIRTILLMTVTVLLTRQSAQQGAIVLAANAILLQLFMLSVMLLDGLESAAQVLCGEALGAGDRQRFSDLARKTMFWGVVLAAVIALINGFAAQAFLASFSTDPGVIEATRQFAFWTALLPLMGVASFVFDGIFIGSGWTRAMLISMGAGLAVYLGVAGLLRPLGNHGLWLAYGTFFIARAAGQLALLPGLMHRSFPLPASGSQPLTQG